MTSFNQSRLVSRSARRQNGYEGSRPAWPEYGPELYTQGYNSVDTLKPYDTTSALAYPDNGIFVPETTCGKTSVVLTMDDTPFQRQELQEYLNRSGAVATSPIASPETSACSSLAASMDSLKSFETISPQTSQTLPDFGGDQLEGLNGEMMDAQMIPNIYGDESLAQMLLQVQLSSDYSSTPNCTGSYGPGGTVATTPYLSRLQRSIQLEEWLRLNEPEPRPGNKSLFAEFLEHDETTSCYICRFDTCRKALDRQDRAIGHIRKHFSHRPFVCGGSCGVDLCQERFFCRSYLTAHVNRPKEQCESCGNEFFKQNLRQHKNVCLSPFPMNVCHD